MLIDRVGVHANLLSVGRSDEVAVAIGQFIGILWPRGMRRPGCKRHSNPLVSRGRMTEDAELLYLDAINVEAERPQGSTRERFSSRRTTPAMH